jgi:hypothetical protein
MTLPLTILAVAAPLGAIDVLYFHLWKFRLHARRASRAETLTHLLRGVLIAAGAYVMARFEPHGAWFWAIAALFALDFVNNLADVVLEPSSRASLGGVPPAEYALHIAGATLTGAVAAAFLAQADRLAGLPTELATSHGLSAMLSTNGVIIAVGAGLLTLFEGALLVRHLR